MVKTDTTKPEKIPQRNTGFILPVELLNALEATARAEGIKRSVLVSRILHQAMGLPFQYQTPGRPWSRKQRTKNTDPSG